MALEPLIVALCLAAEGGPDRSPADVPLPPRPANFIEVRIRYAAVP